MNDYRIGRRSRACMACARPFGEGDVVVSAIHAEGEGFLRKDVCEPCFAHDEGAYSHWRARQPAAPKGGQALDLELASEFLGRLLKDSDPSRAPLAYMLTLLLGRKRRVRIRETRREAAGEVLVVLVPGAEDDSLVEVPVPALDEEQRGRLQTELAELFGFGAAGAAEPSEAPA